LHGWWHIWNNSAGALLPLLASVESADTLVDDTFLCDLDPMVVKGLLDEWRLVCSDELAKMCELCAEKDWTALKDVAHSLKGSSAQLGAVKVSQVAAKLEAEARNLDPTGGALSLLDELKLATNLTLRRFGLDPLSAD
jgi:HPt (histidine-containing phosphotransfer) domain-containing protein